MSIGWDDLVNAGFDKMLMNSTRFLQLCMISSFEIENMQQSNNY